MNKNSKFENRVYPRVYIFFRKSKLDPFFNSLNYSECSHKILKLKTFKGMRGLAKIK